MKPKALVVVLLLLTVLACASRTPLTTDEHTLSASGTAALTVTVLGCESEDGAAVWQVENLQPGTYAVAVYHDLNGNGELDRTTLGPPDEPYGFSNDARGTFGPPKFDKAAIEIKLR